ncbi:HlyD family efflux transporter periplasmic adaptor subunit [Patescibacteria group bacterium]|nr:HlyD family efflux transporter periplasmic adaptor subunit [Patescibacteria group bacterium]MBU1500721.1 HlyD family efflux transporter periplasmic adaptor subunit [Patescibacteria group bacterium]MBU2080776.1 HlyD family efflux transporter periplasmic adaptor subunit [Patescibacteria group bacterium]MBU2123881.1 HlyD family efflux transporter periplasmic adaptor subunit [Patescibacteria group bacterium]MBU2194828.1 HlyD family efflux transporter periplasmic adaptor subunit [Patescibacteria 
MSIFARIRPHLKSISTRSKALWKRYRSLPRWQQAGIAVLLIALLIGGVAFARSGGSVAEPTPGRTVTLQSVRELSGGGSSVNLIGTVRSVTEAAILAQTGGTVRSVRTSLGKSVPAGFILAELENASERAVVLQAEGAYEAAVAARSAQSLPDTEITARNVYRSAYSTLDTALQLQVDTLYGGPTAVGPDLLLYPNRDTAVRLSRERARIQDLMESWEASLASVDTRQPQALLTEAETNTRSIESFLNELAAAANQHNSRATSEQLSALATARSNVAGVLSTIVSAKGSYRSGSTSATASADASVKQALGSLRAAQANLERTVVRAPIGGQVNFLPIRVGDYVTAFTHVATIAQNGALEIVVYVSENDRDLLAAGSSVVVETDYGGVITSVSPALDPVTKQIEVRVAVTGASDLVNGQSVRVSFPDLAAETNELAQIEGPILLPLSSVKLRAGDRIVYTLDEDNRLVANAVTVGEVRGDRIEIVSPLSPELRIVRDARGLSEGEQVGVVSTN